MHLTTGELTGALLDVFPQPDPLQSLKGTLGALLLADAGQGKGKLHIRQDGLMRDEIVALEDEAYAVIAERIPITVRVIFRGDAVYDQIPRIVVIKATDDIQERGLTGTGRAEDGREFVIPKADGDVIKGNLREITRRIGFGYPLELQHERAPLSRMG